MRTRTYLTMLFAPLALAACGDNEAEVSEMPVEGEERAMSENMAMAGEAGTQTASAEGTVTAVDPEAGTITIDHDPVPAVSWPAMNMAFDADEAMLQRVDVGDRVSFDFRTSDSGNELTSITTQ